MVGGEAAAPAPQDQMHAEARQSSLPKIASVSPRQTSTMQSINGTPREELEVQPDYEDVPKPPREDPPSPPPDAPALEMPIRDLNERRAAFAGGNPSASVKELLGATLGVWASPYPDEETVPEGSIDPSWAHAADSYSHAGDGFSGGRTFSQGETERSELLSPSMTGRDSIELNEALEGIGMSHDLMEGWRPAEVAADAAENLADRSGNMNGFASEETVRTDRSSAYPPGSTTDRSGACLDHAQSIAETERSAYEQVCGSAVKAACV